MQCLAPIKKPNKAKIEQTSRPIIVKKCRATGIQRDFLLVAFKSGFSAPRFFSLREMIGDVSGRRRQPLLAADPDYFGREPKSLELEANDRKILDPFISIFETFFSFPFKWDMNPGSYVNHETNSLF